MKDHHTDATAPAALYVLYHELRQDDSAYTYATSIATFRQHLSLFSEARASGTMLRPEITFDDGHVSNHALAAQELAHFGTAAHFFLTVGWIENRAEYMTWPNVCDLHAAGHTIGAHGWSHTLLTHCSPAELKTELVQARETLEDKLGAAVTTMSLPGGRSNTKVMQACRDAGYTHIFTSVPHAETAPLRFSPGRLNILGSMETEWLRRVLDPASGLLDGLERRQRIKDSAKALLGDKLYGKLWATINRHEPEDSAA